MDQPQTHKDDFLLGIARATNALIARELDEGIALAIELLGKQLGVNATCVYVNEEKEEGKLFSSIQYYWTEQPDQSRTAHNQDVPLYKLGPIFQALKNGESYEVLFSESPPALKEHMAIDGTQSIVLFPIIPEGEFWGAVALVEFRFERQWTEAERLLLQSLANSIGAAVCRQRLEENLEGLVQERTLELERSKLRFQLAVEGSQDGIWEWLPQTKESYWSPRMYEQLGYAPSDRPSIGEEFFDMVHPDEAQKAKDMFQAHLQKRMPYEIEFRLRTKSGKYRWFKSTGQAQWNKRGEAIRMVGSHEDIHDKKIKDDLLKKSEERFRAVIRHDPNATFLVNEAGKIELFSDKACALFDYSQTELAGISMHDLLPQLFNGEGQFESDVKNRNTEARGFRKGGNQFWVEAGLSPMTIRDEPYVMVSVTDISKRREAELALNESHRRMNNLVNNLPGIAYRCLNDANWPMEYISAACLEITGYDCEDFYGQPSKISFGELIHADDQEDMWDQVQEALAERRSYRVVYRIHDRRGREKWLWEQGNGVFHDDEVEALEGCIFDITPLVRNQERAKAAIYDAEDSERRRIAGEIHDGLQQTLSVSALNLQYLESEIEQLSEQSQQRFRKSRQYLEQGVKESRVIAHSLMPKAIHDVGLDHALQDMIKDVEEASNLKCDYYCNLESRLDQKTEVGLYRMAQEALNNILKYARASKITMQLVGFEGEIQLMIEDNGIGFDKNKLDLYKTGFGLAGMKNRINSLSGTLLIDSRPEHGTSIVARIPTNH